MIVVVKAPDNRKQTRGRISISCLYSAEESIVWSNCSSPGDSDELVLWSPRILMLYQGLRYAIVKGTGACHILECNVDVLPYNLMGHSALDVSSGGEGVHDCQKSAIGGTSILFGTMGIVGRLLHPTFKLQRYKS